jgi:carboxypeptidase Taq
MSNATKKFEELCEHVRLTSLLIANHALLEWDQQTKLPPAASEFRSRQIGYFAGEIHRRKTDPRLGELLQELASTDLATDPHSDTGATIREIQREYEKKIKLPAELVEEIATTSSAGQVAWAAARQADNFSQFAPILTRIFELKKQEADAIGYDTCRYDALLDEYEPGASSIEISEVLEALRLELVPLVAEIADSKSEVQVDILRRDFPASSQEAFVKLVTADVGFDYSRGRLDTTHHPFCTELGPNDCRITTRFDEDFFNMGFFGSLHEAGHGMYEQGLRSEFYGLPPGQYCSLGIHESQSRLWENLVGRRLSFWQHFFPQAQDYFPDSLQDVALTDFYRAINEVRPSLIRVEADEATYNLHIIIRFQLEQEIINGDLEIADLPAAWNAKYRQFLNVEPSTDADGVLQDIHWSAGLVGYFPTYALGSLYASQLLRAAETALGDLDILFRMGEFQPLLDWLREHVHASGRRFSSTDLGERVTNSPLSHTDLIAQLRKKLTPIYGL